MIRFISSKILKKFVYFLAVVVIVTMINVLSVKQSNHRLSRESIEEPRSISTPSFFDCLRSEMVELAMVVGSAGDARNAACFIKTLVYQRSRQHLNDETESRLPSVRLHIVVNRLTHLIMRTLLDTWRPPDFYYHLYISESVNSFRVKTKTNILRMFQLTLLVGTLSETADVVLFVDVRLRLLNDVTILWRSVVNQLHSSPHLALGLVSHPLCNDSVVLCSSFGASVVNFSSIKDLGFGHSNATSQSTDATSVFSEDAHKIFFIDCSWSIDLTLNASAAAVCVHPSSGIQGLLWNDDVRPYSSSRDIQTAVETVRVMISSEPSAIPRRRRQTTDRCGHEESGEAMTLDVSPERQCAEFRYVAAVQRRTHLYYFGGENQPTPEDNDVTLATQLTVDRLAVLERVLENWPGPASVAVHLSDADVEMLSWRVRSTAIFRRRNVAFHLVYKRLSYNPINYLRNVAFNNSRTEYTFYVDVDLVPNRGLYASLRRRLSVSVGNDSRHSSVAYVVPTFEAFVELNILPADKPTILHLIAKDKVGGYSMKRGWNLGHRPTNFWRWMTANETYQVKYKSAFEPYVVVRTDSVARFDERLLERMADKAMYIRLLHAMRFKFVVLHDAFVIHVRHPRSVGVAQWQLVPGYFRCASVISEEVVSELRRRYPKAKL